ncbi:MAG: hypothetical protein Tsb0034_03340 [Ekhidna sp.]
MKCLRFIISSFFLVGGIVSYAQTLSYTSSFDITGGLTQTTRSFSTTAINSDIRDISFGDAGRKVFIPAQEGNEKVILQYALTKPYDLNTAAYDGFLNVVNEEFEPECVLFNADGTKFYVVGSNGDEINQYSLTTPYTITSGVTHDGAFSFAPIIQKPTGAVFNPDGTILLVLDEANDRIYQYSLLTPFDVTGTISRNTGADFTVADHEGIPQGIHFNNNGTKLFLTGSVSDRIHQYRLVTPYEASGGRIYEGFIDISGTDTEPTGIDFSESGNRLFVSGNNQNRIFEFILKPIPASFYEKAENDGSIEGALPILLDGAQFSISGELIHEVHFEVQNHPLGLIPKMLVDETRTEASLTFDGNALYHEEMNSIENFTISFNDIAFAGVDASVVANTSDFLVETTMLFNDNPASLQVMSLADRNILRYLKSPVGEVEEYRMYRRWGQAGEELIATIPNTPNADTSYVDIGLTQAQQYFYRIERLNAADQLVPYVNSKGLELSGAHAGVPYDDFGRMLEYDIDGGYVEIQDDPLHRLSQGTISFWARFDAYPPGNEYSIIGKHTSTGSFEGWNFFHSGSEIVGVMKSGSTTHRIFSGVDLVATGRWHHIAMTYDLIEGGEIKLYIDGNLAGSALGIPFFDITASPIRMGRSLGPYWTDFTGALDEFSLWSRPFTQEEIKSIARRLNGDEKDLIMLFHFDEPIFDNNPTELGDKHRIYDSGPNRFIADAIDMDTQGTSLSIERRRYVTPSGAGTMDGTSWSNASNNLQAMIDELSNQPNSEVWVAQGVYKPTQCNPCEISDRNIFFQMRSNVAIYGGFVGTENTKAERDLANLTILSGDLDGNDIDLDGDGLTDLNGQMGHNSYHVVYNEGVDSTAVLDGFYITGGLANSTQESLGGGIFNYSKPGTGESSPTFNHVTIAGNHAKFGGGVANIAEMASESLSVRFQDIIFEDNSAEFNGGAVYSAAVINGAIFNSDYINCQFLNNHAGDFAGGVEEFSNGFNTVFDSQYTNCVFANNRSEKRVGGYALRAGGDANAIASMVQVTFTENNAPELGGAIYISGNISSSATLKVSNSIVWGNRVSENVHPIEEVALFENGTLEITHSILRGSGGSASWNELFGTDLGENLDADPLFSAPEPFMVTENSPAIGLGLETLLPVDRYDLDLDLNREEPLPTDLLGSERIDSEGLNAGAIQKIAIGVAKQDQTITFNAIPSQEYGDVITLSASATSDLMVSFSLISGGGELNGNSLILKDTGIYEIQADQGGNEAYNAAPPVTQIFEVKKAVLIAKVDDVEITVGDQLPDFMISYTGFKLSDDESVIDELPSISTTVSSESMPGVYEINLQGGTDNHYQLELIGGTLTIESALSISENRFKVYPNPTTDIVYVQGVKFDELKLFDLHGRIVKRSLEKRIATYGLHGIYLLKICKGGKVIDTQRIKIN